MKDLFSDRPETTRTDVTPVGSGNLTTALVAMSAGSPGRLTGWIGNKTSDLIMRRAFAEAHHEQLRTLLTKAALENCAALAALEAHLREVAPLGEERYKTLLDAHAVTTALRLARW